ncbi:MAG: SDR family oxidoreductase, partial [Bacteroidetes bacterium]
MVILITGASRGIGAALAKTLTTSGHRVLLVSRNREALEETVARCNSGMSGEPAVAVPFDLTELDARHHEFVSLTGRHTGVIDALVNNAGQLIRKPFLETTLEESLAIFRANFFAPARLIAALIPLMSHSVLKHVVNITSMGGFQGSTKFAGLSYYSASKAALGNLTECLAEELKETGLRINALALGSVGTEMLAEAFPGYRAPLEPDEMAGFIR